MTHADPLKTVTLTISQAEELLKRVQKIRKDVDEQYDTEVSATVDLDLEDLEHFVIEIVKPLKKKAEEVPM